MSHLLFHLTHASVSAFGFSYSHHTSWVADPDIWGTTESSVTITSCFLYTHWSFCRGLMLIQYITWKEVRTHKKILTRSFLLEQQYMTKILPHSTRQSLVTVWRRGSFGEGGKRREKGRAQRKGLNKTQTTGESKGNVNMELEMSRVHKTENIKSSWKRQRSL